MSRKKTTTKVYDKILRKDHDFDYSYLLILERFKLKRMVESFELASTGKFAHENMEVCIRDMKLCIKCIDIILEEDIYSKQFTEKFGKLELKTTQNEDGTYTLDTQDWETPTFDHYVNTNNANRFKIGVDAVNPNVLQHLKNDLRRVKAMYLYNNIRNRMFHWWW